MKKVACFALAIAALAAMACSIRTSTIRLAGSADRPPTDPRQVQVYLSEKDVPGPFAKIAVVYAEEGIYLGSPSVGQLVERLKRKAAEVGANGLILGAMEKLLGVSGGDDEAVSLSEKKLMKGVAVFVGQ